MKLKNKRTGEIATLTLSTNGEDMIIMGNDMLAHITKLSELNDYEDYEEPKESKESKKYWFINSGGETVSYYEEDEEPEDTEACKEIGNYFNTREEAEKAVEKLRAWKVLKDMGFKIVGIRYRNNKNYVEWGIPQKVRDDYYAVSAFNDALHLLFGGEA